MQFTGKVLHKSEKIEIGQNATPKMSLILEEITDNQYKDSVMIDWIGDEKVALIDPLKEGESITVHFNLRANEYNGKYYNNLNGWRIENTPEGSTNEAPAKSDKKANKVDEDFEDLPF